MELKKFIEFFQDDGYYDAVSWDGDEALLHSSKSVANPFSASEFVGGSATYNFICDVNDYAVDNNLKPFHISVGRGE